MRLKITTSLFAALALLGLTAAPSDAHTDSDLIAVPAGAEAVRHFRYDFYGVIEASTSPKRSLGEVEQGRLGRDLGVDENELHPLSVHATDAHCPRD